jgi:hypothetical protein
MVVFLLLSLRTQLRQGLVQIAGRFTKYWRFTKYLQNTPPLKNAPI